MDRPRIKFNAQISDEASAWFIECRAGDLDYSGRREFDRWLRKSPEHVSAYLEVAAIWNEGPTLDTTRRWEADMLIAAARRDEDNVVSLSEIAPIVSKQGYSVSTPEALAGVAPRDTARSLSPEIRDDPRPADSPFSRLTSESESSKAAASLPPNVGARRGIARRPLLALAASLTGIAAIAGTWVWLELSYPIYTTAIGEQRSLEFPDGSTVELNSKSKIRVHYSKDARTVDLLEGQALFHVAKDKTRHFIVSTGGAQVRAVGTQFDVYERQDSTVVTVLEGQVAVLTPVKNVSVQDAGNSPGKPAGNGEAGGPLSGDASNDLLVSAGEQLTVTAKIAKVTEHANISAATAWRERRIVFESATLSEVAEEFNRYNERPLVIEDPELYDFHISGVFSSTDPGSLIRFLRARPGVRVTETASEIRVSKNT
jgi:transmembrane sensor